MSLVNLMWFVGIVAAVGLAVLIWSVKHAASAAGIAAALSADVATAKADIKALQAKVGK